MAISTPYSTTDAVQTAVAPGPVLGISTTDLVGFYGAAGAAQASGPQQAALPLSSAFGNVTTYAMTDGTLSAVSANSAAEQAISVPGVLATDLVFFNKLTAQAGLVVCSARCNAANSVSVTFGNTTTGAITPTASEACQFTTIPASMQISAILSPASVPAYTTNEQVFTVVGVTPGMIVQANKPTAQAGLGITNVRVVANNQVAIQYTNFTGTAILPTAAETYLFLATTGISAYGQVLTLGVNVGTLSATASITCAEQTVAVNALLATDIVVGISKPTAQAGLGIAGWRVSAAGTLAITFTNPSAAAITGTASQIYNVTIFRPNPLAVLTVAQPALIPVSVAANTTAEQTFTVSGLPAAAVALAINKPTLTSGIILAGARVSAQNVLALTFGNQTAGAITPPAEVYTIAYSPNAAQTTSGNYLISPASVVFQGIVALANGIRSALVGSNFIPGA